MISMCHIVIVECILQMFSKKNRVNRISFVWCSATGHLEEREIITLNDPHGSLTDTLEIDMTKEDIHSKGTMNFLSVWHDPFSWLSLFAFRILDAPLDKQVE